MSPIPKEWSCRFAWMSVFCSFLIVLKHSLMASELPLMSSVINYSLINRGLTQIAVPFFFFAAGYFLVGRSETKGWYKEAVGKRLKTLMVPFFAWNIIGLVFWGTLDACARLSGLPIHSGCPGFEVLTDLRATLTSLGFNPLDNPTMPQLWFVRTLFLFVLASPAVLFLVRCGRIAIFVTSALVGAAMVVHYACEDTTTWGYVWMRDLPPLNLAFFIGGVWARVKGDLEKIRAMRAVFLIIGCVALILRAFCFVEGFAGCAAIFEVVMICALALGLLTIMPSQELPSYLRSVSFPVYLIHWMVLMVLAGVRSALHMRDLIMHSVLLTILTAVMAIVISVVIAKAIYRFLPKVANIVFGGR